MMSSEHAAWTHLYALVQRARRAGLSRRRLTFDLSPEESAVLAEVLEAALQITAAVTSEAGLDLSEPSDHELPLLAMQGGASDWLADEPDLYSDDDLQERFEWTAA